MDLSADSGTLPTHTTVGGPAVEQELSLSSVHCETGSGGTILLQLLEFKAQLLEAVEELHIRRDAETRFEDQLSKLVLEKQELEWEKESLQQQNETVANQHTESLTNVKKQFQAKIRSIEEEKGKYQVSAELKEKEINNLKEELKSLQLLKYNLEKKSSELEQKLALQSRSKDSHLNQLGEVEKRFSALSRQCAMVKQAHEKLEQNVDEAMRINKKLSSANEKQEATIVSLKKELEEVRKQRIKAKITSVRHDKTHSPTGKEQLHQKLNMETEMNKRLREENVSLRAEKQEVMRSLQHAQKLLLSQTQTVSRVELELQTQIEQYQALKQEHEVMREKSKAVEDKVAQLMESYAASKTSWDKEKTMFLDCIKSEQQDLQAVKEAYDELHQKHTGLSSQAKVQAQRIYELEMRHSSQSLSVSTHFRAEAPLSEPSSELCSFGSVQHLASSQAKNPDCLEDTGVVTKLVATGATGGQEDLNYNQQSQFKSQFKQPLSPSNLFTCSLITNNLFNLGNDSGTGSDTNILNLISKGSCLSSTTTASNPDHRSISGSVDLVSQAKNEEGSIGVNEKKHGGKGDWKQQNNRKEEEGNTEQQWNREGVQRGHVKEGGSTGEKRGMLTTQTTDRADRQEDHKESAEDAGDTRNSETETRDRAEGEGTDGVEERRKTVLHTSETPETQILAQTTADTTIEKSNTQQVIDFMNTEPPLAVSEHSQSLSQKVMVKDVDISDVNKGCGMGTDEQLLHALNSDDIQSINHGPDPVLQELKNLCHGEVQPQDAEPLNQLPSQIHQVSEKTTEEKGSDKSAADLPTELSESLNQSSFCSSQTNAEPLAAQADDIVSIQQLETNTTQTVPSNPHIKSNMKQTDEICDTNVSERCLLVRTLVEPQSLLQSQGISEQENRQWKSVVSDIAGDSSAYKNSEGQSNVSAQENTACMTVKEPVENLKDACVDITMGTEYLEKDKVEHTRGAKTTRSEIDLMLSVHPTYENDESAETGSTKCYEWPPANDKLLDNTDESFLLSSKIYRSSFDWGSAQRKTAFSSTKSDVSHMFVEGAEQNTSWSGGNLRRPPSTIPIFLKSKHNKAPLVITRASDLLNASSVSGTAASLRKHRQGEWKAMGETFRETTAANMESRASLSISSFPTSTSSSRLSWQATPGCSRAPTSTSGLISESDWEPSCSQEREDQQSSFRAQITKIEQFLNTERLRLPKRRRTNN